MKYLLDTNVISETIRPVPDPRVMRFLNDADEDSVFLSVVTLAELRFGIERLAAGTKRERLRVWLEQEVPSRFEQRILRIDEGIAAEWGKVMARGERAGRPMNEMDGWIAALCAVHELALVTRNVADFSGFEGDVVNPWTS